jgi:hypothetical protein
MLKNGDRVDIKMLAWRCRSFAWNSASHNHRRSGNIQEDERLNAKSLGKSAIT